ncbi:MAG: DUF424 family protein [Archaeoglobaceae archaeon]|nr:DUF424 family protein [Archaeoglobaceae archaeon]MCX8152365.1 DUF424 family protein [Archaeoglobaceae archaeon]MDW8014176.1 DUF424 family protein [Archaeoglobaceae archaeon]
MFRMKIYRVRGEVLVAVCDSEIVGKVFREGELKLEITESFYGTEEFGEEEVKRILRVATIVNLSGERSVKLGIKLGIIKKENVLYVDKCPHAQMVLL